MKHSELVKEFIDNKIKKSKLSINSCYHSAGYYFIKVSHESGRCCYTWSKIPPVSCSITNLKSIKSSGSADALIKGSFVSIVPSCDGVVGEYSDKLDILTITDASISAPSRITLVDTNNVSPYKSPIVFPLVSVSNLQHDSWKHRYDDLIRSSADDLILTISKRVDSVRNLADDLDHNIKRTSNDLLMINNGMASNDNDEVKSSISNIVLTIKTLREMELLSSQIIPLRKMLELRA